MVMLSPLPLTSEEGTTLEACSLRGPHPRMRRRALTVLGHHRGQSLPQPAALVAVRYATVHAWLPAWLDHGLAGRADGRRPGRPPKLPAAAQKK